MSVLTTTADDLTPKQKAILLWVHRFEARHGFRPSQREIASAFGFAAQSGVQCHIRALERKGYITLIRFQGHAVARGIRINKLPADASDPSLPL